MLLTQRKEQLSALRPWQAVLAAILGGIAGQVAGLLVAAVATALVTLLQRRSDTEAVARGFAVMAPSVLAIGLTLVATAVIAPVAAGGSARRSLGLGGAPWIAFVAAPLGTLGLAPLADVLMSAMARFLPGWTFGAMRQIHDVAAATPMWMMLPVLAISPGFAEELFFRGMLQRAFGRGVAAVLVSGVAFAAIHLDPHHVAGVLPLGLFLAWVAARTGSTWVTIAAHVSNNALAIVVTHVSALDVGYGTPESMPLWWTPVGLLVTAACAATIVRATRGKTEAPAVQTAPPAPLPPQW